MHAQTSCLQLWRHKYTNAHSLAANLRQIWGTCSKMAGTGNTYWCQFNWPNGKTILDGKWIIYINSEWLWH